MYSSLALGGGGVRGGLHVGALAALESFRGNLHFPEGIYGSSVGSIVATAVAFNLKAAQIRDMFDNHFELNKFVPVLRLQNFASLVEKKGFFTMDLLEETLLRAFAAQNVDLRGKLIEDAPQKLCIISSNMTTHTSTVFSGKVPILDAIKCSSCLPIVYTPQVLNSNVYLDGGVLMDSLESIVPETGLVIHISDPMEALREEDLPEMPIATFLHRVYRGMRGKPNAPNVLWLNEKSISILQHITPDDKKLLYNEGYSQTLGFLSKRFPKELK
jgi:hypothetical protein